MSQYSEILALKALDGLYLRNIAIAENIANSGSASFQPKSVDFETELRRAGAEGLRAIQDYRPEIRAQGPSLAGSEVRLDLEMANASATALRYAALTDILNRQMQINRLAVKGQ
jgi:flagellar basal-body rod protein FlgB